MAKAGTGRIVQVQVDDRHGEAAEMLAQVKGVTQVEVVELDEGPQINVTMDPNHGMPVSELPSRLVAAGFRVSGMQQEQINLETAFMRLTKGIVS